MMVCKMVLRLITNAIADRQIRARLPIVFGIEAKIHKRRADWMKNLADAELAGLVGLVRRV